MRTAMRWAVLAAAVLAGGAVADDKPKKKLLLVTHSGGFVHDSVGVAEDLLTDKGPAAGYEVTCWRFTGDPDAKVKAKKKEKVTVKEGDKEVTKDVEVEYETTALAAYNEKFKGPAKRVADKEHMGRVNADTLKAFDAVLFFTTGNPLTADELKDLSAWVKAGGAFAGTHCATDTLYDTPYGELIGAYFKTHPAIQKVKLKVEDAKHPAATGLEDGMDWTDEYYVFRDKPYSRDKLHVIVSIDSSSFKPPEKNGRTDDDYAVSWCKEVEKGKVFYTSLGHRQEVWRDEKFRTHLFGGLDWATGRAEGDATPSKK